MSGQARAESPPPPPPPTDPQVPAAVGESTAIVPTKRRFNNGWTREIEILVEDWADKAQCFRWMHDKTSRSYHMKNQYMMIPVIILSTLTGTANFGLDSLFSDPGQKKLASFGIGGVGILTGIITTLANFLRYAQGSEAHSGSAIAWGKFARFLNIEMALHPNDRMEAFAFLKMFRIELDRLIEQSPQIPETIIAKFKHVFRSNTEIRRPDITGAIDHTHAFDNKNERMKQLAVDASLMLLAKKQFFKDIVIEDLEKRVRAIIDESRTPPTFSMYPYVSAPAPILRNPIMAGGVSSGGRVRRGGGVTLSPPAPTPALNEIVVEADQSRDPNSK